MDSLKRFNIVLNKGLSLVAGSSLVAMVLVTVGEMVFRMFGKPMAGTFEIIGWLAAVTTAFALGYTQIHQGHVSIDLFAKHVGRLPRMVADIIVYLSSSALFMLVTWHVFLYAGILLKTGSLSETMKVIVYPWVYLVSLGCAGLTMALFVDFLKSCYRILGRGESPG